MSNPAAKNLDKQLHNLRYLNEAGIRGRVSTYTMLDKVV
jgi:hypothetical protein